MTYLLSFIPISIFWFIIVLSILALVFIPFFPLTYRLPVQVVSVAILSIAVYLTGAISTENEWKEKVAEVQREVERLNHEAKNVTEKVVTKYVERVKIVKEKGDQIVKEVPIYITKEADAKCAIPDAFVSLHDGAAKNEFPDSTRKPDEGTSEIKLSEVTKVVVENYNTCNLIREQLISLQEWIHEQQKINP